MDKIEWYAKHAASKILDFRDSGRGALFLGTIYDTKELARNGNPRGITAVLDVSAEDDYDKNPSIVYSQIPFPDGQEIPADKFAQCMSFLKHCWLNNMTIQVNCSAGVSRSTSIVVSFMYITGICNNFNPPLDTMEKILDYVRFIRPVVRPNSNVFRSCKKWLKVWPYCDVRYEGS